MAPLAHEIVLECFMGVDIVLKFFTAYIDNYELKDDLRTIALNYITGMLFIDLVAVLPFYLLKKDLLWLKLGRNIRMNMIFKSIDKPVIYT